MAPPPFALVRWVDDDEPDCWQVIKTAQIQKNPGEISEGIAVDAIWKKGEETSVAEILKLGDNKSYLTTVMENEYVKPWREKQLPPKRVSIPKKLHVDFVCEQGEGSPTSAGHNLAADSTQQKSDKKRKVSSGVPKQPAKKQKKKDKESDTRKLDAAKAADPTSDSESDEHEKGDLSKTSKAEAEKVLAKKFLQKQRTHSTCTYTTEQKEQLSGLGASQEIVDEGSKEMKRTSISSDDESSDYTDVIEKGPDHSESFKYKGCCKFCKEELSSLKEHVRDLASEVTLLRKQVKKVKRTSSNIDSAHVQNSESSKLERECRELVSNSTSVFNTVNTLMRQLFTEEEIASHSVSGKAANSKTIARPKFDASKMELLKKLAIEIHKELTLPQITQKIQAVQKSVRKSKDTK